MADPDHPPIPRRVVFRTRYHGLARNPLQSFADLLSKQVLKGNDFACLITSDQELAELNQQYRKKAGATDVLSFPAIDSPEPGYAGDIAISVDHARAQARRLGHGAADEVRVLMLHGALHLAGMDHELDDGAMRKAERRWRKRLGLPVTLIERAI